MARNLSQTPILVSRSTVPRKLVQVAVTVIEYLVSRPAVVREVCLALCIHTPLSARTCYSLGAGHSPEAQKLGPIITIMYIAFCV